MLRIVTTFAPLGLALLLAAPALAQGGPRSVSECERLKNDLAYNQCLAMFGPAAKNVGGGDGATTLAAIPPGIATAIPITEEPAAEMRRGRRGARGRYARHGRHSASFTVGGETGGHRRHRRRR